jgi:DNA polymerase
MNTMAEATFYNLVENLEHYLEYQRDNGVRRLEVDRTVVAELNQTTAPSSPPSPAPVKPIEIPSEFKSMAEVESYISICRNCGLHQTRQHSVPGEGQTDRPDIFFIGEAPEAEEDAQGRPFVGAAGQLLTKMIAAMGYRRDEVFITNVMKCRPPNKRLPLPDEIAACQFYLEQQIKLVQPKVIVALGATALRGLLGNDARIMKLQGIWQTYKSIPLMPTFHPISLLRDSSI